MPATLGYVIATPSELPGVRTIHNGLTIHDPGVRTIHNGLTIYDAWVHTIHNGLTIHGPGVRTIYNKWMPHKQRQLCRSCDFPAQG